MAKKAWVLPRPSTQEAAEGGARGSRAVCPCRLLQVLVLLLLREEHRGSLEPAGSWGTEGRSSETHGATKIALVLPGRPLSCSVRQ